MSGGIVFRRRRRHRSGEGRGELVTRLASADSGLYFDVRITYEWGSFPEQAPVLHGDEVARSLLYEAAAVRCAKYPAPQAREAQDSVNALLSESVRTDERMVISGRAQVCTTDEYLALARRREVMAHEQRMAEAAETVRLESLRERLVDQRLGPVWWIDRYADLQFATGDPAAKMTSVLTAFDLLAVALRRGDAAYADDDNAVLRARVGELLATLEDPATRKQAANVLETALTVLVSTTSEACEGPDASESPVERGVEAGVGE